VLKEPAAKWSKAIGFTVIYLALEPVFRGTSGNACSIVPQLHLNRSQFKTEIQLTSKVMWGSQRCISATTPRRRGPNYLLISAVTQRETFSAWRVDDLSQHHSRPFRFFPPTPLTTPISYYHPSAWDYVSYIARYRSSSSTAYSSWWKHWRRRLHPNTWGTLLCM